MSKTITTPSLVAVEDISPVSATFVVEPLQGGYGMTLGNSLRRVLLSSIAGAGVTSFKVEGATHEFTTIKGVKEDVVAISLNLKGLRFRVYGEDAITLRISKKGKGAITGKDITGSADVEVVNKDHVIATIDDDKTTFVMDIVVETGRGYRTIEESTGKKHSEYIALDTIFSPVLRVRYKVEKTRVGTITDLDKLSLTVDTDGTITPRDAFEEAAAILVNQYTALAGKTRIAVPEAHEVAGVAGDDAPFLSTSIEDLGLTARTTNALVNNDIHTVQDLVSLSDAELRDLKGFGSKALDEVRDKIAELEI